MAADQHGLRLTPPNLESNLSRKMLSSTSSDEADGPLDPERKRMFMAMKREVLRLGGYKRELHVSQTPELTAMADAVIDLEMYHPRCRVS